MINNLQWLMDRFFQEYPHWKPANYEPFFDAYTYSSDEDTSSDYCTESDIAWLLDRFFQEYPHWKPANYEPYYSSDDDTSSDYCTESDTDSEDDYSDLESDEEFEDVE